MVVVSSVQVGVVISVLVLQPLCPEHYTEVEDNETPQSPHQPPNGVFQPGDEGGIAWHFPDVRVLVPVTVVGSTGGFSFAAAARGWNTVVPVPQCPVLCSIYLFFSKPGYFELKVDIYM